MKKIVTLMFFAGVAFVANAQTQFINDPSFETGANSTVWNDMYYPDSTGCIVSGTNFGHTGNKCLSMIIEPNKESSGKAEQVFVTTQKLYNCKLEFYIKCELSSGASTDIFAIRVNYSPGLPEKIFTGLKSDSAAVGNAWKKFSINVDSLNLLTNSLSIFWGNNLLGSVTASPAYSLYYLDDITITSGYPTAINEVSMQLPIVSPTLFTDQINIDMSNAIDKKAQVQLYNINGQKVLSEIVLQNNFNMQTNHLPAGIYLMKMLDEHGVLIHQTKLQKM
jgi:Secretion system C-terminal sorting domain